MAERLELGFSSFLVLCLKPFDTTGLSQKIFSKSQSLVRGHPSGKILKFSKKSITFFLDSSIETLTERLKKNFSNRPLLNKGNLRNNIEKLYQKRIKDYMMAKHIILVDHLSVEDVVLNIIKRI